MKQFVNVVNDPYVLYDYCKKEGYTEEEFEDWDWLSFFEGDPDLIKVDGETGYFCECGDIVFYYLDDFTGKGEKMLQAFFEAFRTGITLGCNSFLTGEEPEGVYSGDDIQNWDAWEKMDCGIAWRGGAGYIYDIFDFTNWVEK